MDVRSPFFQNVALILAGVLFLNPIVATAAQLAVDGKAGGNTSLGQAGNGVPLVNIATPNGKGLSHNKFSDYNVGQQGLILNNATGRTQATQLGGIILGNPNLQGKAAGMILNEVTGANPSHLRGYTEVAGQAARVIVANPHGITCDGCGFINTPRATLSTGRPIIEDGRLSRFDVDGGQIAIEGAGLNASNLEQFDLITRSAKLNAELHANELNVVTGRNQVDADSLAATAKADDGKAKPALAIDSSALGGMYAGAIRLVGTEAGVGVKLAGNLAASAGDIQIDAAGNLTLAQTAASGNLALKGRDVVLQGQAYAGGKADVRAQNQLAIEQSLAAAGNVSLQGAQVVNQGVVEAGVRPDNSRAAADLKVSAQQVRNAGTLIGNRQLQVNASQTLDNQGGTLSGKTLTQIDAAQLDNRSGRLLAEQQLKVESTHLNNAAGLIQSQGAATVSAGNTLDNRQGDIRSNTALTLTAGAVDNRQAGLIASQTTLAADVASLDNRGGGVSAKQGLTLKAGSVNTGDQGLISSGAALTLDAGRVEAANQGEISAKGDMSLRAGEWLQQGGQLIGEANVSLDLRGGKLDNQGGLIAAQRQLTLGNVGQLDNRAGTLSAQQQLTLSARQVDNRDQGLIGSAGALVLDAERLDSSNQGEVSAQGDIRLRLAQLIQQQGRLIGGGRVTLDLGSGALNNRGGVIHGKQGLELLAGNIDNRDQGLINSAGALSLVASRLDSSQLGEVSAVGDIDLSLGELLQRGGQLIGEGKVSLDLKGGKLDNQGGLINAQDGLELRHIGELDNAAGELSSAGDIAISGEQLNNRQGGRVIAAGQLALDVDATDNSGAGLLSGWQGVRLDGTNLDNSTGGTVSSRDGALDLILSGALDNSDEGAQVSQGAQRIQAGSLDNRGQGILSSESGIDLNIVGTLNNANQGLISAPGLLIQAGQTLNQSGQINSAGDLLLSGGSLDNSTGSLSAAQALSANLTGALRNNSAGQLASGGPLLLNLGSLDNRGGQLASQGLLQLFAASLDNSGQGTLAAQGDMTLTLGGALVNRADGLIYSRQGALNIEAASLDNDAGTLQAKGSLDVDIDAAVSNKGGRILSESGGLDLSAERLDNSAGGILASALGSIRLALASLFDNRGGTAQARQDIDLGTAANGQVRNAGGHLSAVAGNARIHTGTFDNQGGGLYAGNLLDLDASSFANQGAAAGLGGKVSASTIDFSLAGALNNVHGLIEAGAALRLGSASLDNRQGALRALGQSGESRLTTSGTLDNRGGRLEVANANLALNLGSLLNAGGSILHVGSGNFGLASSTLVQAGGTLVTNGALSVNATTWSHSGTLQARELSLNVGTFTQSSGGQLLATQRLSATGGNWSNAGLIASDGSLDLTLSGAYNGSGRLTSLGNLTLKAASLDLASAGSIAGGALSQLTFSGLAVNRGQLTSSGDFTLRAATLNNHGTLGSAERLSLYAPTLYNERGLIFSGGDMALRSLNLTNLRGNIYSLGGLDIAANDSSGWASRVENTSGTLESAGNMRILANSLINQRAEFTSEMRLVSGNLDVYWDDYCDGKGCELYFTSVENYEDVIIGDPDAPIAFITSGGNLDVLGSSFDNLYSTVSAAGNIGITVDTLRNIGMAGGEQRHYNGGLYTRDRNIYNNFISTKNLFNLYNNPNGGDYRPGEVTLADIRATAPAGAFVDETSYSVPTSGAVVASAIIQAGGAVNITASQRIDNSVVREYAAGVGQIGAQNTGVDTNASTTNWAITSQLPPDLAQKQVDPLSLPGFSLPTGDNGLFRLSGQAGQQGQQSEAGQAGQVGDQVISGGFGDSPLAQQLQKAGGLPTNGRSPGAHKYLIETNPALTNLKTFLGSDYLLGQLGYDPDQAQKRLGDGLYEQHLIRQAIVERTGQRYLAGLYSDEAMFRYLMDNALASKDRLGLSLGVSLTAQQVAALTHDIVWMEEREVLGEKVLVPVLYLAQAEGRLAGNGALIQGSDLNLISGGDLNNVGTLRASGHLNATAGNLFNGGLVEAGERLQLLATDSIRNAQGGILKGRDVSLTALTGDVINERSVTTVHATGGGDRLRNDIVNNAARIEAAGSLAISAGRDIQNLGSAIVAGGDARLDAGRDLVVASQAEVDTYEYRRKREHGYENSVTQHGASLEVGGNASLLAGRDAVLVGSRVDSDGSLVVGAGQDLIIDAAADEYHRYANRKKGDTRTISRRDAVVQQGSELTAGGDISLLATGDVRLRGSSVNTDKGALLVSAGGDVSLESAQDSYYESFYQQKKKSGTFSSSSKASYDASGETLAQGSLLSGNTVQVQAGHDINVSGSAVVSTEHTRLLAGNDVTIDSATESHFSEHFQQRKKSGLMSSGGIGVTLGSSSMASTQKNTSETAKASTIGSILGNVDIQAGKTLTIQGSDVVAGQNINLIGENVNILAAQEQARSEQTYKSKSSGLTLALSGAVGGAINTAYETSRQARGEEDGRLAALQGVKAGLTGVQAWQAVEQAGGLNSGNVGELVGISLSLGSQKSSSQQVQEQSVSQGSSLSAGNNLNIIATGQGQVGEDGDIRIQGSQLKAGQDMTLAANRDILLEAAANTQKLDGKNKSSGGAVGVSLGVGGDNAGLSVFASGNQGSGREKGNGTTWTETTLDAGRQVSLISGRDTSLIGAQVSGEQITANVGRDLTLRSLQDSDEYDSRQKNVSAGASLAIAGAGGGANFSASQSKIESDYRSVQEQTGLYAGKGGFQIDVGNHTQLDGAVIASTADADNNRLSTGTLGWSDIRNEAQYSSQHQGVGISSGGDVGGQFLGNLANGMLVGMNNGDDASSTTRSAISEGTLEIRDSANQRQDVAELSRDVENANNALSPIFDKEKEQRRLQQAQLIGEIGAQSMDIIRTQGDIEASKKAREELAKAGNHNPTIEEIRNSAAYKDEMSRYGTGSDLQRAAQAVTAALQGLSGGDLGSALAGASGPYLANLIKGATEGNKEANLMAHAVLGAVVAQAQGGSAAAGAAGAAVGELIAASLYPNKNPKDLTESEKQTVSALSTLAAGLAGAAVGGDAAGALAGAQGGKNAAENNHLGTGMSFFGHQLGRNQVAEFSQELKSSCDAGGMQACLSTYSKWREISYSQGGLATESDRAGWEEFVRAAYTENVLPLCKGNPSCESDVNASMSITMVVNAGDAVGLKDSIGVATRAFNIANGNWVRTGLQIVEDAGLLTAIASASGVFAKAGANVVPGAKATVDVPIRSLDQLLPNGKVPSVRGGAFNRWFDELSSAELDVLWQNKATREAIEARIRQPGGLHEWCMVCRTPDFKKWGVPMEEIQRFRTKTTELKWISPIDGKPGGHGSHASSTFHNELKAVIDNSRSLDDFNAGIVSLRDRWKIDPKLLPPLPRSGGI